MGSQDLQQARYDQLLRRVGGLYGGGSKVTEVLPELFPTLDVENLPPELLFLTGWRAAWQNIIQTAVAAQTSAVQLSNPAESGVLAVVTRIDVRLSVDATFQMLVTNTLFTSGAIRGLFRDGRSGGNRTTALQLRSDPNIATGAGVRMFLLANANQVFQDDNEICVLPPGFALQVGSTSNNVDIALNYYWRERTAERSELFFP